MSECLHHAWGKGGFKWLVHYDSSFHLMVGFFGNIRTSYEVSMILWNSNNDISFLHTGLVSGKQGKSVAQGSRSCNLLNHRSCSGYQHVHSHTLHPAQSRQVIQRGGSFLCHGTSPAHRSPEEYIIITCNAADFSFQFIASYEWYSMENLHNYQFSQHCSYVLFRTGWENQGQDIWGWRVN